MLLLPLIAVAQEEAKQVIPTDNRSSKPATFTGIWELKKRVLNGDYQVDSEKQITWVENSDYCSYTSTDGNSIVHPGRFDNSVLHYSNNANRASNGYIGYDIHAIKKGTWYRGVPVETKKIKNLYCCPIKSGIKTDIRYYDGNKQHVRFSTAIDDTIYAMRGGAVCLSGHPSGIVVYHSDCSFGVYRCFNEVFVNPGDQIHAGQPLGLSMGKQISVYLLYLDKQKIYKATSSEEVYTFFYPSLMTELGVMENNTDTTIVVPPMSDEIMMLDMNKTQQKKYLKEHNLKK